MSKEFLDRLARGELTSIDQYQRMKDALHEIKNEDSAGAGSASKEWQSWELSPEWSTSDAKDKTAEDSIRADSVQHALDKLGYKS